MQNLAGVSILVVDDEIGMREILREVLELEGAVVHEADGGRLALKIFEAGGIDVIVSDVQMPDGHGDELLRKMRLCKREWPVIFLYSGGHTINSKLARDLGALDIFYKPLDDDELIAAIVKAIADAAKPPTRRVGL